MTSRPGLLMVGWMVAVATVSGLLQAAAPTPQLSRPSQGAEAGRLQSGRAVRVPGDTSLDARAILTRYCVSCHTERLRVQGRVPIALDEVDVDNPSATAEIWENIIRKVRTGAMPPAGLPRPDESTARAFVSWIETELDRASAGKPDPGRSQALRRLTRTEYRNAVRDLLGLEAFPQEMNVELLLPADNSTSGFDNLADLLSVDPTLLEQYLAAARKISRLAVGDPTIPPLVDNYRFPADLPQDHHIEGLPLGTRGGATIRSYLPVDGEYLVRIEFDEPAREEYQLDLTVDGAPVQRLTHRVLERPKGVRYEERYADVPAPLEARLPLKSGPHEIGVAYVEKSHATHEGLVRSIYTYDAGSVFSRGGDKLPRLALVTLRGPFHVAGAGDSPSRRRIFTCHPATAPDEATCQNTILSTLARRAYRRPVTDADLQMLRPFYEAGRTEGGFDRGIQRAIERLLVSPEFIFRIERDTSSPVVANTISGTVHRINDLELASRISFFLWSSIPDDELLDAAIDGRLNDPTMLQQHVVRMLSDKRSDALVNNFAAQWLYLRDLGAKAPDARLFPGFDEALRQALSRETELFVESIVREDRSIVDLLVADYTFVNERLARHYGIPHVYGSHFRRVALAEDSPRRGLLGKGSILTLTSLANRTSPVLRGKWVLENILSSPPPPPPPDVPALNRSDKGDRPLSMRDAMVLHRTNPVCSSCHARMDPLGFAMENFDAIGKWQAAGPDGKPLDVSGVLPDGRRFEGVTGLREILWSQRREFANAVAEKLLTYALGRNLDYHDAPAVRAIMREGASNDYRVSSLVLAIVKSVPFQLRRAQS